MSTIAQVNNHAKLAFTKTTKIQINGIGFPAEALCDTGADCELLASPAVAFRAQRELKARIIKLEEPFEIGGLPKESCWTSYDVHDSYP